MSNTSRVDKALFEGSHYLGKPADASDLIIDRRIQILKNYPFFFGKELRLLEIGCGNGITLLKLAPAFDQALGLEYVEDHKNEFLALQSNMKVENAAFAVWDISAAPYPEPFDRLISFEVIEHLPSDHHVENYFGSLKSGGWCAITVPNKWWIFETHGARLPLIPWNRVPFFSWLPRPIHERFANARIYTSRRIVKLLKSKGFEIHDVVYVTAPMDVVKWKPLQNFLRKYIFKNSTTRNPFLAVSVFVIAKKL